MKENMNNEVMVNAEAFATATQMYVRLRRVHSIEDYLTFQPEFFLIKPGIQMVL